MVLVVPFARNRGADIGLVQEIGRQHLDRLAQDRAADILDRHFRRDHIARTLLVGEHAGHVVKHA